MTDNIFCKEWSVSSLHVKAETDRQKGRELGRGAGGGTSGLHAKLPELCLDFGLCLRSQFAIEMLEPFLIATCNRERELLFSACVVQRVSIYLA